ncbi:Zinc finger C2H2-type [Fusarium oxysporum f. sp. vasinfectum]|uniref:C2H2-type domain-containing protein n=1 Tax=Fusarium oxysporum f. sp. vasinfectum 25433 TaxID=1089449 RepID=X0MAZ3_FUSOX|nr:hypothetical protein FOTG_04492 [Fusarium oxysporum f. sp. vasinfectum 25433]KAK2683703.1 Zinc finger C2H2-type [Fusarium oxysporum f. sp. vasinfectum]KAK2937049.1 Zinc finger C2H2-type [Fusarium oxysporum f. sp. vasinfectum]
MSRRSDRSHRHSRSSRSHQSQQDDIPIDPNLTSEASYPGYSDTQGFASYSQAGPSVYATASSTPETQDPSMLYYMTQQPTTVNPNEVLLSSGSSYATQNYPSSYPTAEPTQPEASSSTVQGITPHYCSECDRFFGGNRDLNKHMKTHNKPVKCKADPNCNVAKAEQRDMDRHYRTSHRAYAASKGILTEERICGFEGCTSKFTRQDNLLKHWKKFHNYEQ